MLIHSTLNLTDLGSNGQSQNSGKDSDAPKFDCLLVISSVIQYPLVVLQGKVFYLTPSVMPGRTWLREIIECAGGSVENKRAPLKDIKERNK